MGHDHEHHGGHDGASEPDTPERASDFEATPPPSGQARTTKCHRPAYESHREIGQGEPPAVLGRALPAFDLALPSSRVHPEHEEDAMAARRTDVHRLQEAVRLHRLGRRERKIARDLRMSRNTVQQAFKAFRAAGLLDGAPAALPGVPALKQALAGNETLHEARQGPRQVTRIRAAGR